MSEWQLCPKCDGQGVISWPPGTPAGLPITTATAANFTCDLCKGAMVIAPPPLLPLPPTVKPEG